MAGDAPADGAAPEPAVQEETQPEIQPEAQPEAQPETRPESQPETEDAGSVQAQEQAPAEEAALPAAEDAGGNALEQDGTQLEPGSHTYDGGSSISAGQGDSADETAALEDFQADAGEVKTNATEDASADENGAQMGLDGTTEEDVAAAKIQAIHRGNRDRKNLAEEASAATKIQAVHRGNQDRKNLAEEASAATKIQAVHRGKQDRKNLAVKSAQAASGESQAEPTTGVPPADEARAEAKKNSVFAMLADSIGQKPGTPRNKYAERYNSTASARIEVVKNPPRRHPTATTGIEGAATAASPASFEAAAAAKSSPAPSAAMPVVGDQLFRNLHLAELQTLLVTMGMPSDGGKYELLGRLQDTLEARGRSDGGVNAGANAARQRDQLGREMPAWQQQQIEEGGQAYSGKGIFSAMAQDRVQARAVLPQPQAAAAVGAAKLQQWPQSRSQPQPVEDRRGDAYAAAWQELESGRGTAVPTFAQEARHVAAATASSGSGFYGSTAGNILPSPPVGPRPEDQRTPRQLRASVAGSATGSIGGSATNLQDRFDKLAAADELLKQDQQVAQNLDLLAELTGDYDDPRRTDGSLARGSSRFATADTANGGNVGTTEHQRDRRAGGGVAARGPEIDRGRRKSTRGHRNRAEETPAMALRRKIRASSYHQGGEDWKDAFKQYDRDESGELDFEEFKRAMRRTAKISPATISDKELKKLFKLIDLDSGGSISADEFVAFLEGTSVRPVFFPVLCCAVLQNITTQARPHVSRRASS